MDIMPSHFAPAPPSIARIERDQTKECLGENVNLKAEINGLKAENRRLEAALQDMQALLNSAFDENSLIKTRSDGLSKDLEDAKSKFKALQFENNNLRCTICQSETSIASFRSELGDARLEITRLAYINGQNEKRMSKMPPEIDAAHERIKDANILIKIAENDLAKVEGELAYVRQALNRVNAELEIARTQAHAEEVRLVTEITALERKDASNLEKLKNLRDELIASVNQKTMENFDKIERLAKDECPVCYQEQSTFISSSECTHIVCTACMKEGQLKKCPCCRAPFGILTPVVKVTPTPVKLVITT
jgi:chromosome segregation ATPase